MSFISELKRRNVFKVGIAYVVTSWLMIQVTDILFETIGAPPWVMKAVFVILAVGFVIALIFAWAFELTPEGVKKEKDVDHTQSITNKTGQKLNFTIATLLVISLAYIVYDKLIEGVDGPDPDVAIESPDSRELPIQKPLQLPTVENPSSCCPS